MMKILKKYDANIQTVNAKRLYETGLVSPKILLFTRPKWMKKIIKAHNLDICSEMQEHQDGPESLLIFAQ